VRLVGRVVDVLELCGGSSLPAISAHESRAFSP
jgi:hypothetical protein